MTVRTSEDARALLRSARDVHVERHGAATFTPGTHLPLEPAAQRLGIRPGSFRYGAAIEVLEEDEGAIERDASARYHLGNTQYLIAKRGLAMLLREGQEPNPPGAAKERCTGANPDLRSRHLQAPPGHLPVKVPVRLPPDDRAEPPGSCQRPFVYEVP
jgi:hypothetical protein